MFDLHNNVNVMQSLDPDGFDSDEPTAVVDRQEYEAVEHVVLVGGTGATLSGTNKIEFIIQHGDESNGSDMAAVTEPSYVLGEIDAAGIFATVDANGDLDQAYKIGYRGPKRYSRVLADFSGTHAGNTELAAVALRGRSYIRPVE